MSLIETQMVAASEAFQQNRQAMLDLIAKVRTIEQRTRDKSEGARARFAQRGQLLPRERLSLLLDPGAPFFRAFQPGGLGARQPRPRQKRAGRRGDRWRGLHPWHALHGDGFRCRH